MSYAMDLIDIGLNVDLSGLREKLHEIEDKLEEIDGAHDITEDKVREIFSEMAHDEGEQLIRDTIANEGYVTEDDVTDKIKEYDYATGYVTGDDVDAKIESAVEDFCTSSDVRDIIEEQGLTTDDLADATEVIELKEGVAALETRLADLERRFEMYASRVDTLVQANTALNERLDVDLTHLVGRIEKIESRSQTALDFFGLIQQAFNLLKRGA